MKRNFVKIIAGAALAFSIIALVTFGSVLAQNESDSLKNADESSRSGGGNFSGTWEVAVTIRNCQTWAAIRTFPSVTTFMHGGTLIDSTSAMPQSRKTPGHGVWSHAGGNTYSFSFKVFNFDAAGNYTGWQTVRQTAYLDPLRDEYFSRGTSEIFDPNGNLLMTGCSSTTAARFQ